MIENRQVYLADGRRLGYVECGAESGAPVIYFHGIPGSGREAQLLEAAARARGLRVIAPDRPGYGRSERNPSGSLTSWAQDVAQLAGTLGVDRFAVLGVSGGAPYALACAWQLADRVTAAALVCALGPMDSSDALRDMAWPERFMLTSARCRPGLVRCVVGMLAWWIRRNPEGFLIGIARMAPAPDRAVLQRPLVRTVLARSMEESVRGGTAGVLSDLRTYTRPWGFDVRDLDLPLQLWHGERDRTVPVQAARRLARRLPRSRFHVLDGEGHYSLPLNHMGAILDGLAPASQRI
ncbi:MAG TPA: alpha/beta hydrolase [Gammaproteobacteria bacterium]|nr:alpha/beta hydrolase [Gammaproteobacteria bacterium]